MSDYIWTLTEIEALPEFGNDWGWFYGLVRNHETGRVWLYEVFPGMGYAAPYLRTPRSWWQALQDVRVTPLRKERGRSVAQNGPRRLNTIRIDISQTNAVSNTGTEPRE